MRILAVQMILHDLHANIKCRHGWTSDFNLARHRVLRVTDWFGKSWVVDDDGTKGDGYPAVWFVEVVLTDLERLSERRIRRSEINSLRSGRTCLTLLILRLWTEYTSRLAHANIEYE